MYRRATTELSARSRLPNSPLGRSRRTEKWGTPRSRGNSQIRSVPDRRSRHRIPAKSNRPQDRNHHFPNEVKPLERPAAARSRLPRAHRIHSTWPDRQDRALALPVSSPLTPAPTRPFRTEQADAFSSRFAPAYSFPSRAVLRDESVGLRRENRCPIAQPFVSDEISLRLRLGYQAE
jgi:hypothetical protein